MHAGEVSLCFVHIYMCVCECELMTRCVFVAVHTCVYVHVMLAIMNNLICR